VKNLQSIFAAYLIGWGVFFVFFVSLAARWGRINSEIERLKKGDTRGGGGK